MFQKKYNLGDIVYFDPVSSNTCNESTFDVAKVKDGSSTCYKWRVMEISDTLENRTLTIMLDHNIVKSGKWAATNNVEGPTTIMTI